MKFLRRPPEEDHKPPRKQRRITNTERSENGDENIGENTQDCSELQDDEEFDKDVKVS